MKNLILVLSLLFLAACSQGQKTSAEFSVTIGGVVASANMTGGMLITGKSAKGATFSKIFTGSSSALNVELPNGTWNFMAIAWEGANATGKPRCGTQTNVVLSGSAVAVSLNITNAKCFDGSIGNTQANSASSAPDLTFEPLDVAICRHDVSTLNAGYDCILGMANTNSSAQSVAEYQVLLRDQNGVELAHACKSNDGTVAEDFPYVDSRFHFPMVVKNYVESNTCTSTPIEVSAADRLKLQNDPSVDKVSLHVRVDDEQVCTLADQFSGPPTFFVRAGLGTLTSPHAICNWSQMHSFSQNFHSSFSSKYFQLLRDIDMLPHIKTPSSIVVSVNGKNYGNNEPVACLETGDTFVPIGTNVTGYSPCTYGSVISFTGKFHGMGHTINHFRYKNRQMDNVGLFAQVSGSGEIAHLKLTNVEVEGRDNVGAVVGNMTTGSIHHLYVTGGTIEGEDYVGGIAGKGMQDPTDLYARDITVRGLATVGGVVGQLSGGLTRSTFSGSVHGRANNVGGIAGSAVGGTNFYGLLAHGYVRGGSTIGGLLGGTTVANTISFSRFVGTVKSAPESMVTDLNLGGLVGIADADITITNSYFDGHMIYDCAQASDSCQTGSILGSYQGTQTTSNIVSTVSIATGGGFGTVVNVMNTTNLCGGLPTCDWTFNSTDMPRLTHESYTHAACAAGDGLKPLAQQTNRGTEKAPYLLCTRSQLVEMNNYPTKHFRLMENLPTPAASSQLAMNFSGVFDGASRALTGGSRGNTDGLALFENLVSGTPKGTVKDLFYEGVQIVRTSNYSGLIANYNSGLIKNVHVRDAFLQGGLGVGGIAYSAAGEFTDVSFEGTLHGHSSVGGIAGFGSTAGSINRARSRAIIYNNGASAHTQIGGIIGASQGVIKNSIFDGSISLTSAGSTEKVGGITGYLYDGSLVDSHVTEEATISVKNGATYVGGIVGNQETGVTLERTLFSGNLHHMDGYSGTTSSFVGSIAGAGSVSSSNFHESSVHDDFTSGASVSIGFVSGQTCSYSFSGIASDSAIAIHIPKLGWFNLSGLNSTPMGSFTVKDPSACTGAPSFIQAYDPDTTNFSNINYLTYFSDLTGEGFQIKDFAVAGDQPAVLKAHLAHILKTTLPENEYPVWLKEHGEFGVFINK